MRVQTIFSTLVLTLVLAMPAAATEAAPSFTDVPETREEFSAVEDLRDRGIVEGRPDGSFGPDDLVNRAEAVTIVVRAVANVRNLPPFADCFPDVTGEDWYVGTVCYAKDLEWIGGYPDGLFQPVRTVSKVEFLKILLNAYGVDTEPLQEWRKPLAADVLDPLQWYFPYLTFALASSMTHVNALGNLNPGAALTRGQVALLMHRFLLYREGQRTEALHEQADSDIRSALEALEMGAFQFAEYASVRAQIALWGTGQREPDAPPTQAMLALSEGLRALMEAEHRAEEGKWSEALQHTQEAYRAADTALARDAAVQPHVDRMHALARVLADEFRSHGAQ